MDQAALDAAATLAALVRTKRLGTALMVMSAGLLTVGNAAEKWGATADSRTVSAQTVFVSAMSE